MPNDNLHAYDDVTDETRAAQDAYDASLPDDNGLNKYQPDPTPARPDLPTGALVAAALMAANIPCDSGEDVDRLIAEMRTRGLRIVTAEHSTAQPEPLDDLAIEQMTREHFEPRRHFFDPPNRDTCSECDAFNDGDG